MILCVTFLDGRDDQVRWLRPTGFPWWAKDVLCLTFFEVSIVEEVVIPMYNLLGTRPQGHV